MLLEDIKSAELQYLISTQQEAAVRQAQEAHLDPLIDESKKPEHSSDIQSGSAKRKAESSLEDSKVSWCIFLLRFL